MEPTPPRQAAVTVDTAVAVDSEVTDGTVSAGDVAAGVAGLVAGAVVEGARRTGSVVGPALRIALDPPILPADLRPIRWLSTVGRHGAARRRRGRQQLSDLLDLLVPEVVEQVLRRAVLAETLPRHLDAVLERMDLTQIVLRRVDLDVVIGAVLDRVDLAALAEEVVNELDLPEIIRDSTGSMASDTVRGARMRGIAADEVIGRVRGRLLLRRSER